ncbi:MAG TPA: peptidyl-prolyl cis-trans isomerase [Blastocatellia bacterium]|jgi:parvulin-like peptidyl-prolyl isomerase|nr:peptidyl-prolyl cis-trans isomerase [Blastocatellia bacterium]
MNCARPIFLLCLAALGFYGCRGAGDRQPVIASVNGNEIRREDFERFLALKLGEFNSDDTPDALRSQMLDEYIRRRLALDEAARAGLSINDAEIEQAAQENPQVKSAAAAADTREELARDLLVEKYYRQVLLRDVRVSPEEVQQYIEQNQSRLTDRPGFYVREIRVQSRAVAERLRGEVTEGRQDFAALARLHSDAPNAEQGGLARYDEGQLPDILERAIKPLRPGDVSPVIQSGYGFHMFKLERRVQPHPPEERRSQLDDRRAQLAQELVARKNQQAVDEALERLAAGADIKINDSTLGFTYTGQLRHN